MANLHWVLNNTELLLTDKLYEILNINDNETILRIESGMLKSLLLC